MTFFSTTWLFDAYETKKVIKNFEDFMIRFFDKSNGGVSSACNVGLDNANGKYITFVDPLKKMQSLMAVGCKALRIFYKILKDGVAYDGQKMMSDIIRPEAA